MSEIHFSFVRYRSVLQKVGVIFLPSTAQTEQDAELDSLYSPVMTSVSVDVFGQEVKLEVRSSCSFLSDEHPN